MTRCTSEGPPAPVPWGMGNAPMRMVSWREAKPRLGKGRSRTLQWDLGGGGMARGVAEVQGQVRKDCLEEGKHSPHLLLLAPFVPLVPERFSHSIAFRAILHPTFTFLVLALWLQSCAATTMAATCGQSVLKQLQPKYHIRHFNAPQFQTPQDQAPTRGGAGGVNLSPTH